MTSRAKLPFKRYSTYATDMYCRDGGRATVTPRFLLGDELSSEDVNLAIADAEAGDPFALTAVPRPLRPPDFASLLVRGLRPDNTYSAAWLANFLDLQPVRTSVLAVARATSDPDQFTVLAHLMARLGASESLPVLRRRFREFEQMSSRSRSGAARSRLSAIATTAGSILVLDPECVPAADALSVLARQSPVSVGATHEMARAFRHDLNTRAMAQLRDALQLAVNSADFRVAIAAAPAAIHLDETTVLDRMELFLRQRSIEPKWLSIGVLARIASVRAHALLVRRLSVEPDVERAASIAVHVAPVAPESLVLRVAKVALANRRPFVRWRALQCCQDARLSLPHRFAYRELATETDPALRRILAGHLQ